MKSNLMKMALCVAVSTSLTTPIAADTCSMVDDISAQVLKIPANQRNKFSFKKMVDASITKPGAEKRTVENAISKVFSHMAATVRDIKQITPMLKEYVKPNPIYSKGFDIEHETGIQCKPSTGKSCRLQWNTKNRANKIGEWIPEKNESAVSKVFSGGEHYIAPIAIVNRFDMNDINNDDRDKNKNGMSCGALHVIYARVGNNATAAKNSKERLLLSVEADVRATTVNRKICGEALAYYLGRVEAARTSNAAWTQIANFLFNGRQLASGQIEAPFSFARLGQGTGQIRGHAISNGRSSFFEWRTNSSKKPYLEFAWVPGMVKELISNQGAGNRLKHVMFREVVPKNGKTEEQVINEWRKLYRNRLPGSDVFDGLIRPDRIRHQNMADILNFTRVPRDGAFNKPTDMGRGKKPTFTASSVSGAFLTKLEQAITTSNHPVRSTASQLINRAQATTCMGCHGAAKNLEIGQTPGGEAIRFTGTTLANNVHIDETGSISTIMESLIPSRQYHQRLLLNETLGTNCD